MRRETRNNKIVAILFILLGIFGMVVMRDATLLMFAFLFGLPLFLAKRNWIDF